MTRPSQRPNCLEESVSEQPSTVDLMFLLIDTARHLRHVSERAVENNSLGLTPGAIRTLGYVMRYPGLRQAVLAERMDIEPMTLSSYLDRLERCGVIERTEDPSDRRAKLIKPTERSVQAITELDPTFDALYRNVTRGIEKAEMDALAAGLRKMRANVATDPSITAPFTLLPPSAACKAADDN